MLMAFSLPVLYYCLIGKTDVDPSMPTYEILTESVKDLKVSSKLGRFAASTVGGKVKIWDLPSGKEKIAITSMLVCDKIVFSRDGQVLACGFIYGCETDGNVGGVKCFDARTGKETAFLRDICEGVVSLAFDGDGRTLSVVGSTFPGWFHPVPLSGELYLWNYGVKKKLLLSKGLFRGAVFLPDGNVVALRGNRENHDLVCFDATSGRKRWSQVCEKTFSFAQSDDGKRLALVGLDGKVSIWDLAAGKRLDILDFRDHKAFSVAFGLNDSVLAVAADNKIRGIDIQTKQEVFSLDRTGTAPRIAFSQDSKYLIIGNWEGRIRVWEITRLMKASQQKKGNRSLRCE